mmetsp:Transcript_10836/g.29992  ORF Transcript_10836/g.29992 Transcript_10836/m.29992 type:complete len:80 (-) Transcript_10836:491-730(-)
MKLQIYPQETWTRDKKDGMEPTNSRNSTNVDFRIPAPQTSIFQNERHLSRGARMLAKTGISALHTSLGLVNVAGGGESA